MKISEAVEIIKSNVSEKKLFEMNYKIQKFGDFEISSASNSMIVEAELDIQVKKFTDNFGPKFRKFAIEMNDAKNLAFPKNLIGGKK